MKYNRKSYYYFFSIEGKDGISRYLYMTARVAEHTHLVKRNILRI